MSINIRTKGATGEREVCKMLNAIVDQVRADKGLEPLEKEDAPFQRNQNQTAVGGADITNPFELSIEVKRQEQLSVGSWWDQCVTSANRTHEIPILIFKQNRKKWRVCMNVELAIAENQYLSFVRAEIELDVFKQWFKYYYEIKLGQ